MDFSLTEDQKTICASVADLAAKRLNGNVFADDEAGRFPHEKWAACAALGIQSLPVPETCGGMGASMLTTALAIETLAHFCTDEGLVFSICAHICTCTIPILHHGTEEQKRVYLPGLAAGSVIGGNGSSEAGAGSDLSSMHTSVSVDDAGYRLSGSKLFVTNGTVAGLYIIYGRHSGGMKMADISAFIVPRESAGVSAGQIFQTMGLRTCPLCEIILDGSTVPKERLLGRERLGMTVFNTSMLWERIIMAAYHVGAMQQQLDAAIRHATERRQFGKRIIEFEDVSSRLVAMRCAVETSRLLLYKTCCDFDGGRVTMAQASLLKLHASESKVHNSMHAVQIFGAAGVLRECMAEKQLRDSMAATIYSGTSEIQKKIIAEEMSRHG